MAFVVRMVRLQALLLVSKPRNCVWPSFGGAIPFEDKMSKALLKEGLKLPKEKVVKAKPYTEKASVKKAVSTLDNMSKTPGALPL